jgi:NTE family protein
MTLKTRNAIGTGSTSGIGLAIARALAKEGVNRLVDSGKLSRDDYMRPFVHRIDGGRHLEFFPASWKLDASWTLISKLQAFGREAAKQWLDEAYDSIGREGTFNLWMAYS